MEAAWGEDVNGGQWPQAEGWHATLGATYGLEGEEEPTKETEEQPVSPEGSEEGRVFGEGRSGHLGEVGLRGGEKR